MDAEKNTDGRGGISGGYGRYSTCEQRGFQDCSDEMDFFQWWHDVSYLGSGPTVTEYKDQRLGSPTRIDFPVGTCSGVADQNFESEVEDHISS